MHDVRTPDPPNVSIWAADGTDDTGYIGLDGLIGDFDEAGRWTRLERDIQSDISTLFPGETLVRVTGVHVSADNANGNTIYFDDLRFSNSLTIEHNVLEPGRSVGHIVRNRASVTGLDTFFHYDQVGSVIARSDASGALDSQRHADAFGNDLQDWTTGLWDVNSSLVRSTKTFDADARLFFFEGGVGNTHLGRLNLGIGGMQLTALASAFSPDNPPRTIEDLRDHCKTRPKAENGAAKSSSASGVSSREGIISVVSLQQMQVDGAVINWNGLWGCLGAAGTSLGIAENARVASYRLCLDATAGLYAAGGGGLIMATGPIGGAATLIFGTMTAGIQSVRCSSQSEIDRRRNISNYRQAVRQCMVNNNLSWPA